MSDDDLRKHAELQAEMRVTELRIALGFVLTDLIATLVENGVITREQATRMADNAEIRGSGVTEMTPGADPKSFFELAHAIRRKL